MSGLLLRYRSFSCACGVTLDNIACPIECGIASYECTVYVRKAVTKSNIADIVRQLARTYSIQLLLSIA